MLDHWLCLFKGQPSCWTTSPATKLVSSLFHHVCVRRVQCGPPCSSDDSCTLQNAEDSTQLCSYQVKEDEGSCQDMQRNRIENRRAGQLNATCASGSPLKNNCQLQLAEE